MKNRIKVLRAERDMTQGQLASEVQVSRQTINAIEKGKFDPSLPLAFRAARLFGMAIEEIFQDEDRKSTRLNSSHVKISYAVFCLKKKKEKKKQPASHTDHRHEGEF